MKPNRLAWSWPALELPTSSKNFTVTGMVVPYDVLCWLDREGGIDRWTELNPNPGVSIPPPVALFLRADVILATGRAWDEVAPGDVLGLDPFTVTGSPWDDVLVYGQDAYAKLVFDKTKRPADLKVLVVPLDLETDELHRLTAWVEYLRGSEEEPDEDGFDRKFVPPPWRWDRDAGARE